MIRLSSLLNNLRFLGGNGMQNFEHQMLTKIYFGKGQDSRVGELIKEYGGSRVLLIHYGGWVTGSAVYATVTKSLSDAGLYVRELTGVLPNPRVSLCREGAKICREENLDFILALGGDSVIDTAKTTALAVGYDGDVWDFFAGTATAEPQGVLPIATVVTISATGSDNNSAAVINNEDGMQKICYSHPSMFPKFSVLNPEVTYTLPPHQTACGAVDIIAHVLDTYTTNEWDNELVHSMIEAIIKTALRNAPIVMENPYDYNARAQLMWAASLACNGSMMLGSGRDGTSHNIEHELGAIYDITHGDGLSIIIPGWYKYLVKEYPERFIRMATRIFGVELDYAHPERTAMEGVLRLEGFFKSLGMPTRFSEVGIDDSRFEEIADRVDKLWGTYGQIKPFGKQETMDILRLCL